MPVALDFVSPYHYIGSTVGIEIPISLGVGRQSVEFLAKLHVESGRLLRFVTVTGSFVAYEHEVTIQVLGIEFSTVVFFAHEPMFNRNFLGRAGWLDRLQIGIVDYDRMVFLSPYQF